MENEITSTERPVLSLSANAENYLITATRWSKFLGILGFIGSAFMIIAGLGMGVVMSTISSLSANTPMPFPPFLISLIYLLMGAFYGFLAYYLFNFGSKVKEALLMRQEFGLDEGLKSLKMYFTLLGVMVIVGIGLMLLAIFGLVLAKVSGVF